MVVLTALVVCELYLGLIHVSCVMSHFSSFQRVQHIVGIIRNVYLEEPQVTQPTTD
jgi:hypothetical protein